jgi:hypothetical protein
MSLKRSRESERLLVLQTATIVLQLMRRDRFSGTHPFVLGVLERFFEF